MQDTKYQIWSLVLGNTISEIRSDGTKAKTKVFAGGAVIAEQYRGAGGDAILWTHADPVTGSSTQVSKSGAEGERKELEPLGQEVRADEPSYEEMPPGAIGVQFSASDPEGSCHNWAEHRKTAISCEEAMATSHERFSSELLSSATEKNPLKITGSAAWRPDSRAGGIAGYALRATSKPPEGEEKPPSIGQMNVTVPISFDDDAELETITVTIGGGQDEINVADGQIKQTKIKYLELPSDLKERIEKRAGEGTDCAAALKSLIDTVADRTTRGAYSNSITGEKGLFEKFKKDIKFDKSLSPFSGRADSTTTLSSKGTPRIGPVELSNVREGAGTELAYEHYVTTIIHELVHFAVKNGTYSDRQLAEAANEVLKGKGVTPDEPLPIMSKNSAEDIRHTSTWWQKNFINRYCKAPDPNKK